MKKLLLAVLSAIAALLPCTAQSGSGKSPVAVSWEVLSWNDAKRESRCRFTIRNVSGHDLKAGNWSIYFNHSPKRMSFAGTPFTHQEIRNNYFRLTPKAGFRLKKGATLKLDYTAYRSIFNQSEGPDGGHFAYNGEKALPMPIDKKPVPYGRFGMIAAYPTAEKVYAQNAVFNPTEGVKSTAFDILPAVKTVKASAETFSIPSSVAVSGDEALGREKAYATEKLVADGFGVSGNSGVAMRLSLISRSDARNEKGAQNKEYYELDFSDSGIEVRGVTRDAVLNGVKTVVKVLRKNKQSGNLPKAEICDWPDFNHRGFMLDIARNFTKAENIKKYIDKLAEYKLNFYQFHFTDDEGWRLEIPGLPELTEVASRRGMTDTESEFLSQYYAGNGNPDDLSTSANGYISRDQFIELLRYADARGIRVAPEIESPGHARAAIIAMKARYNKLKNSDPKAAEEYMLWDPEDNSEYASVQGYSGNVLNAAQEGTYRFMSKVIDELVLMYAEAGVELPFVHLGGDEVANDPWKRSPMVKKLMQEKGWTTTHQVEEYYITRMAEMVAAKGYKIGGWQEAAMNHSAATDALLKPAFAAVDCWSTLPQWKRDSVPYSVANNGYNVVLCNVGNFYLDLAYTAHQEEPGATWGGYVNEFRAWEARPFDIYHSLFTTADGRPLDMEHITDGKEMLKPEARKRILGVQGQLWAETIRNYDMVEYYTFPKIFGLAERGWNADLLPGQTEAGFNLQIGTTELPELKAAGYNFHLNQPGIIVKDGKLLMNAPYPGAEVRYTTDGSVPTAKSKLWTAPVKVSGKVVKAKAFYLGKESVTTEYHK